MEIYQAMKTYIPIDPVNPLVGNYTKKIKGKKLYFHKYGAVVSDKLEWLRGMASKLYSCAEQRFLS